MWDEKKFIDGFREKSDSIKPDADFVSRLKLNIEAEINSATDDVEFDEAINDNKGTSRNVDKNRNAGKKRNVIKYITVIGSMAALLVIAIGVSRLFADGNISGKDSDITVDVNLNGEKDETSFEDVSGAIGDVKIISKNSILEKTQKNEIYVSNNQSSMENVDDSSYEVASEEVKNAFVEALRNSYTISKSEEIEGEFDVYLVDGIHVIVYDKGYINVVESGIYYKIN